MKRVKRVNKGLELNNMEAAVSKYGFNLSKVLVEKTDNSSGLKSILEYNDFASEMYGTKNIYVFWKFGYCSNKKYNYELVVRKSKNR